MLVQGKYVASKNEDGNREKEGVGVQRQRDGTEV